MAAATGVLGAEVVGELWVVAAAAVGRALMSSSRRLFGTDAWLAEELWGRDWFGGAGRRDTASSSSSSSAATADRASVKTMPLVGLRDGSVAEFEWLRRREIRTSWLSVRGRERGKAYWVRWGVSPVGWYSMRAW